jgi:WD40 repeat protein
MNKSKIVFVSTIVIILAFIVIMTLYYSKAVKKKMHFMFQLGEQISRPHDDIEPEYAAIEIKFSNDDSKIITLLNNGDINIWDLDKQDKKMAFHTNSIFSFCSLNDFIIVTEGELVLSVDINTYDKFKLTTGKYKFSTIDKDCNRLALSDGAHEIEVWNLLGPKLLNKIKSELPIRNGLSISPNGAFVAAAEGIYDSTRNNHETIIEIWKLDTGKSQLIQKLDKRRDGLITGVWNIFYSPDNEKLIYDTQISAESGVSISDLKGDNVFEKSKFDSYWTRALAISPDGKTLASGDEKGNLVLWDIETQEIKSYYRMGDVIESLAFSNNGTELAAGLANSTIQVFKIHDTLNSDI